MKKVSEFTTSDRLKFIAEVRANPELAAAVASIVLELAEYNERELTSKKGVAQVPGLLNFRSLSAFKAFFSFQSSRASNIINKHFKL